MKIMYQNREVRIIGEEIPMTHWNGKIYPLLDRARPIIIDKNETNFALGFAVNADELEVIEGVSDEKES